MTATVSRSVLPAVAGATTVGPATASRPVRTSPAALMLNAGPPANRLQSVLGPRALADLASGGEPLSAPVRARLEETFGVSLSDVRVRSDQKAQQAVAAIGARAFAHGRVIFLGPGESPGDVALLAHEVAHVVQQHGSAPAPQMFSRDGGDHFEREAHQASAAALQGGSFTVRERTPDVAVQRFGISDALDWIADRANNIPGFRMLTIILGTNPINLRHVDRTAANVLRAVIEFLPGGALITQALDGYGIIDRVASWISAQIDSLGLTWSAIKDALSRFLDSLGLSDLFHLGDVWDRAVSIFSTPINRIIDFGRGLVDGIIRFIKDAILRPLAELASQTPAWDLFCAVLGRNPITGDAVPRNAETLIGGFMKMIGQEEIWQNIQRANAIPRAFAWFEGALEGLMGFVREIPGLFLQALRSLELMDIVLVPRAFIKIGRVFGGFFGRFFSWAGGTIWNLLEIIFEVLAPAVLPYLKRAAAAFRTILRNPIGFIQNLVRAGVQGFQQFAANFLTHLRASLVAWLTGALGGAGVYIPQAFEIREIIKFVLSVLGLTWQNVRTKLVRRIGEPAVVVLERTFDIVITLVTQGPAAAWERIRESLSNLKDMVMEGILTFVRDRIVQAAITRLVTSLNPAGAFIQAILAIYNTIMFLVERLRQIAQVLAAFIDSISAIAGGAIAAAAGRVESTMEGLLTLVISFLARLVGLGRVSDAVLNIINRVRAPIDRALDRVIDWIVTMAQRAGRAIAGAVGGARPGAAQDTRTVAQREADLRSGIAEADALLRDDSLTPQDVAARIPAIRSRYRLATLGIVTDAHAQDEETDHIEGSNSPPQRGPRRTKRAPDGQTSIHVTRSTFTVTTRWTLRANFPSGHRMAITDRPILRRNLDRRHVISSQQMAAHYEAVLNATRWRRAKTILQGKGETVPDPLGNPTIQTTAQARHARFFNDERNLFIGDASENRSIGAETDIPEDWSQQMWRRHFRYIKDTYALDGSFAI